MKRIILTALLICGFALLAGCKQNDDAADPFAGTVWKCKFSAQEYDTYRFFDDNTYVHYSEDASGCITAYYETSAYRAVRGILHLRDAENLPAWQWGTECPYDQTHFDYPISGNTSSPTGYKRYFRQF